MVADLLTDLLDVADTLTEPYQCREPRWMWDANRNKKKLPDHVVVLPGLLQQVADIAYPGSSSGEGGGGRPVPASRPPVQTAALSTYLEITVAVTRWCLALRIELRDTVESNLRAVLGVASTLPRTRNRVDPYTCDTCEAGRGREHWSPCHHCTVLTQVELITELRGWQRRAEVITGWRKSDPQVEAPCPHCGERQLRINLTSATARCGGCRAEWSDDGVPLGVLAQHIAAYREASKAAAARARKDERDRKARYARPATASA